MEFATIMRRFGCEVTLETVANGQRETLIVDRVLVAVGRTPQSENLGLEALREIIVGKPGGEQEQLMIDFGFLRTHQ